MHDPAEKRIERLKAYEKNCDEMVRDILASADTLSAFGDYGSSRIEYTPHAFYEANHAKKMKRKKQAKASRRKNRKG